MKVEKLKIDIRPIFQAGRGCVITKCSIVGQPCISLELSVSVDNQKLVPREARAEGPSVARLINLSGRAGPSGAKPREFERKIYLYIYIYIYICVYICLYL